MKYLLKFYKKDGLLVDDVVPVGDKDIPYEVLKDGVEGYIEFVYHVDLGDSNLAIIVNEEGLLEGLGPTFWLYSEATKSVVKYPLVGNILIVRLGGEDTFGLSEEDIQLVKSKVMCIPGTGEYFLPVNDKHIEDQRNFVKSLGIEVIDMD